METKTIGKRIDEEVRKQQWKITDFADRIHCTRNNVYDIFNRNKVDIIQLGIISKVLNHNFFEDIAKDLDLLNIENEETQKDLEERRAVSQFVEVMPKVLEELGKEPTIAFGKPSVLPQGEPLPDFVVCGNEYIGFTIGSSLKDKANKQLYNNGIITVTTYEENGISVDVWKNHIHNSRFIDIKLDFKTIEEWKETMKFVFEKII